MFESLADHPQRLIASAMGVFWGAAAIVFMLSFGSGFREYMITEMSRYGEGIVFMFPASTSSGFPGYRKRVRVRLARDDVAAIARAHPGLIEVALAEHLSETKVLVEGGGHVRRLDMVGSGHRFVDYRNFEIGWGRSFTEREVDRRSAVALLGLTSAEALFGSAQAAIDQRIRVEGRSFKVIGVPRLKGRQYMNVSRPDDKLLIIPITTAEARLGYDPEQVSGVLLIPRDGVDAEVAVAAALKTLGPRAGFHPDDADAIKWFDTMIGVTLTSLLSAGLMVFIGVSGMVTLLIGGVGIANYHLATLAERTIEIAVCKALGAKNRTLVAQTVLESVAVSGGASLAGVLLGASACMAIRALTDPGVFPAPIVSGVATSVTLVAVLNVSVVAAVIPALRVRKMEISAALRAAQ
ncbi:MAG: ABC transporter permease [Myxococcota bacterium]|nr:ABC transporter permease [Myxococcota bacterium]